MIELKQINGEVIDLSKSAKFVEHYNNPNTYAKYIIDNEINNGIWYDELLANLPENSTIIDAGANVGLFSLYIKPKIGKVYALEPTVGHVGVIQDVNKVFFDGKMKISNFALWNVKGSIKFVEESNSTMNHVEDSEGNVMAITLKRFMDYYMLNNVDLLKLDIEGAEQQVIMEDSTIEEPLKKCKNIFIEVHPLPWGNADEKGIIEKVKSFGFTHKQGKRSLSHYFINKNEGNN